MQNTVETKIHQHKETTLTCASAWLNISNSRGNGRTNKSLTQASYERKASAIIRQSHYFLSTGISFKPARLSIRKRKILNFLQTAPNSIENNYGHMTLSYKHKSIRNDKQSCHLEDDLHDSTYGKEIWSWENIVLSMAMVQSCDKTRSTVPGYDRHHS